MICSRVEFIFRQYICSLCFWDSGKELEYLKFGKLLYTRHVDIVKTTQKITITVDIQH